MYFVKKNIKILWTIFFVLTETNFLDCHYTHELWGPALNLLSSNIMQLIITWSAISCFEFNWEQFDIKGFTIFTFF